MSGVYRSMRVDGNKPLVGNQRDMLGVRENGADILIAADSSVAPGTGGLSVAPDWRSLPSGLVPRRLRDKLPDARGSNRLVCFRFGNTPFAAAVIATDLRLSIDSSDHGIIEPASTMPIAQYQDLLAATRETWVIDED